MLLNKYKPCRIEDMINKDAAKEIRTFIQEKRKMIITGPIGSGKTLSLEIIAKDMKYELITITDEILSDSREIMKQRSIFYKGKIFVIDLDSVRSLDKLEEFIKEAVFPIIMTADDIYQKRYYEIRKKHQLIKFRKIADFYLANIIKRICTNENIRFNDIALNKLISLYNGDVRAVLISLECLKSEGITPESIKNMEECKSLNVFDILTEVFNSDLRKAIRAVSNADQDINPWIEENVIDGKSLEGYENLAKADLFKTRTKRTNNWSLDKYYYDFIGGISTLKTCKRTFNPPYSKRIKKSK